jgi:YesN/AraC family two-component response regulator
MKILWSNALEIGLRWRLIMVIAIRQFICQRLTNSFTVIEADNGRSGFVSAIKNLPDIIISDIAMPVM